VDDPRGIHAAYWVRFLRHIDYRYLVAARHAEAAVTVSELRQTSDFTRREQDFNSLLARDGVPAWERRFEFRLFAHDLYDALGSRPK
jgi:hypothetical protein